MVKWEILKLIVFLFDGNQILEMGVCLRRLDEDANPGDPILPLESADMFMEECAGVLQAVIGSSKYSNKLVHVLKFTFTTIPADFR